MSVHSLQNAASKNAQHVEIKQRALQKSVALNDMRSIQLVVISVLL